jgi:hypothetical protein
LGRPALPSLSSGFAIYDNALISLTVVEFLRKHQQQQERNLVRMKLNFGTIDLTSRKAGSARNAPPGLFAAASRW